MNKKFILKTYVLAASVFISSISVGQITSNPMYTETVNKADSFFKSKEYITAASMYSNAFKANAGRGKIKDRYNAACCWALIGNPDSAFFQLYRIAIQGKYTNYEEFLKEPAFSSLHKDKRWEPLIAIMVKARKDIEDSIKQD